MAALLASPRDPLMMRSEACAVNNWVDLWLPHTRSSYVPRGSSSRINRVLRRAQAGLWRARKSYEASSPDENLLSGRDK